MRRKRRMRRKMQLLLVGGIPGVKPRERERGDSGDLLASLIVGFKLDAEFFYRISINFSGLLL